MRLTSMRGHDAGSCLLFGAWCMVYGLFGQTRRVSQEVGSPYTSITLAVLQKRALHVLIATSRSFKQCLSEAAGGKSLSTLVFG